MGICGDCRFGDSDTGCEIWKEGASVLEASSFFCAVGRKGGADASSGCTAFVGSGRLCGAEATLCLERWYRPASAC